MNCAEVEKYNYTEKYLLGALDEAEVLELEEHYFSCAVCAEALKDASALCHELADERWAVGAGAAPAQLQRKWVWAVAATVVLFGIGIVFLPLVTERSDAARSETAKLAAIEAPPYAAKRLRSPAGEAERLFREAMALYQEGDYAGAIPGLDAAARADSESTKIVFYLGACYLLTNQPTLAIERFGRVVELGKTPYLERARLYRAKALLREGKLETAKEELAEVVRLGGEQEAEAQRILERLRR